MYSCPASRNKPEPISAAQTKTPPFDRLESERSTLNKEPKVRPCDETQSNFELTLAFFSPPSSKCLHRLIASCALY